MEGHRLAGLPCIGVRFRRWPHDRRRSLVRCRRTATDEVHTYTGPGRCGWQSTVWLHRGDALYIRDPGGIFATQTVRPYAEPGALPSSAVDTGLHSVRWRLFAGPSPRVAWMVRPDGGIEAWPRAKDPEMGCA